MNINNFAALLRSIHVNKAHIPLLAWGESGIGKSDIVRAVARDLGINAIDLRLGQQEVGDLIGLPRISGDNTCHIKPEWWPAEGTEGILFLDELNRSRLEVRQAIFQLILDRRLHTHKLPVGWTIVSACNPATEDYDSEEIYDKAFIARFLHIALEPTADEWLTYAAVTNTDWTIRALIGEDKKFLGTNSVSLPKIRPTPRSWRMLSTLIEKQVMNSDNEVEIAAGLVGIEAATAWQKLRHSTAKPIKAAEILDDYSSVRNKVLEYSGSTKRIKDGKEIHIDKAVKKESVRQDLLRITLDDLAAMDDIKHVEALAAFLLDIPKDLSYAYLKLKFIRNKNLRPKLSAIDALYEMIASINKECGIKE